MLSRRLFIVGGTATAAFSTLSTQGFAQGDDHSFDALLTSTLRTPGLLESSGHSTEGRSLEFDIYGSFKAIAPRYAPSGRSISQDAAKMIIAAEITDEKRYTRLFQGAVWPKGKSGATIGIGYDVGYVTHDWLRVDWDGILRPSEISSLQQACGIHGAATIPVLAKLSAIKIPWADAYKQFMATSLPRYTAEVLHVLPNAPQLSDDCLGAIVSLVYNRGPSFELHGKGKLDRYFEMRAIRLHMVNEDYHLIPAEIRAMKRLWTNVPDSAGLLIRRELEARLFERGISKIKVTGA